VLCVVREGSVLSVVCCQVEVCCELCVVCQVEVCCECCVLSGTGLL